METPELHGRQEDDVVISREQKSTLTLGELGAMTVAVGIITGLFYLNDKAHRSLEFKKASLPRTPIEQVGNNKCEGTIMTIGDLRLRMPKSELSKQVGFPQEQTPPRK